MLYLLPQNPVQKSFVAVEPKKNNDLARIPVKYNTYSDRSSRRGGISRNAVSGNAISCKSSLFFECFLCRDSHSEWHILLVKLKTALMEH